MSESGYDLVILGSGSAAFAAAIRARSYGARVGLVEAHTLGGTCVNVGCVPSKVLLEAAQRRHDCPPTAQRMQEAVGRKDELVAHLRRVKYEDLLARYDLDLVRGEASFEDAWTVRAGSRLLRAGAYIIATGASPNPPPIPGLREAGFITSTEALDLRAAPSRLAVIGGNAIGLELGQYFARMGSTVAIFEALSRIAPFEEPDSSRALHDALTAEGLAIFTGARITSVRTSAERRVLILFMDAAGAEREWEADAILVATGRRPNTDRLNLKGAGVRTTPGGAVATDAYLRTDSGHIFAAGDVTGAPQFVYVAAYQGGLAADNALGKLPIPQNLDAVPRVIFTQPRLAAVGETEEQARGRGAAVETAVLDLGESVPRAIVNRRGGILKLVVSRGTRTILGAHMVGEHADEVIVAATYAVRFKLTAAHLIETFHPYLTMGESLRLCAQALDVDPAALSCCAA